MSREIGRRGALAGVAAALAGCGDNTGNGQETATPTPEERETPAETPEEVEETEEPEEVEPEGSIFGDAILEHNSSRDRRFLREDEDHSRAGVNLTEVYETVKQEYENRPEDSIEDFGGFFEAANTIYITTMDEIGTRYDPDHSTFNNDGATITDKVMEEVFDFSEGFLSGASNPGGPHGIGSGMSPEGHYLFDIQFESEAGRTGTDPIDRPDTEDVIYEVDPEWVESEEYGDATYWQSVANQVFNWSSGRIDSSRAGFQRELVEPMINIFKDQGSDDWEMLLDQVVPASMATAYISSEQIAEDEYIVLNPERLEELPSISSYLETEDNSFQLGSVFNNEFAEPEDPEIIEAQRNYIEDLERHYRVIEEEKAYDLVFHPHLFN